MPIPFRPSILVAVAVGAAAAFLLGAFAYDQHALYKQAITRAETHSRTTTALLAEHAARTFEAVEETLRAVEQVRRDAATGGISADRATLHNLLKIIHGTSPLYVGVGWVDETGTQIASSRFADPPPLNIAGQEQFHVHRDGTMAGMHITAAFRSVRDGRLLINVSARAANPDGSFAGIVAATLDPTSFARVYRMMDLGPSQTMALLRADGAYLAREPDTLDWVGRSLADNVLFREHLPRAASGIYRNTNVLDGIERIVSYTRVPGLPLVVASGIAMDDALADFRRGLAAAGARAGAAAGALLLAAWLLAVQIRRRESVQSQLETSEERFRDFASASCDWFWETDEQHRFVWVSDTVEKATGLPAAWYYGKSRMEMSVPGVAPEAWEEHRRTLAEHRPYRDFEYLRRGPNGDRWLRSSGVPILGESGRFRGYRGSGSDVTELRRAERLSGDLLEAAPDAMVIVDVGGRIVLVNAQTETLFGFSRSELLGQKVEMLMPEAFRARHSDYRAAYAATPRARSMGSGLELQARRKDGSVFPISVSLSPLQTERGLLISSAVRDMTEAKRRETNLAAAMQTAADALADAEKANRAKSDFLSRMSHELRTPLNAVIGFAEMLRLNRPGNLTADQMEYSEHIRQGGRHLLSLVNEVLDLSGIEAGRLKLSPERVVVADIVAQALATVHPTAEKAGIRLEPLGEISVADVRADMQRLRQVLINLLSNAIKYNRTGGSVTLAAHPVDGDRVRIAVTDTGFGVSSDSASHLFEPFHRLGAEYTAVEGVGIGLALSKKLVEAMNGRIGYTTEPGKGSTFWIELPRETGAAALRGAQDSTAPASAPLAAAGGYSLLYVEDNPANLRLMEHLIGTLPNVAMLSAPEGQAGIDLAMAHRPDVIVLDLNLPGMSGFEILARLRALPETQDIPVLALTAAAMPNDIRRGLAAGFYRYIVKPLDVKLFLETVGEALAHARARRAATGT